MYEFMINNYFENLDKNKITYLALKNDGDEAGFTYMGSQYHYLCIKNIKGVNHLQLKEGYFNQDSS